MNSQNRSTVIQIIQIRYRESAREKIMLLKSVLSFIMMTTLSQVTWAQAKSKSTTTSTVQQVSSPVLIEIQSGDIINPNHVHSIQLVGREIYIKYGNSQNMRAISYSSEVDAASAYFDIKTKLGVK